MILFERKVVDYLDNLIFELYTNEYFGFIESSELFVDKIINFIIENIETFPSKNTPLKIKYLGSNYIFYKSNQHTTWYVFFENEGDNFLITHILTNKSKEIKWL